MQRVIVASLALLSIIGALLRLEAATEGLSIHASRVGTTPVTVFRRAGAGATPLIVLAHGFAGSQQFMQPFAVTLAQNGYTAVTFDFPGHGRNPDPLPGGLGNAEERTRALEEALDSVVTWGRGLPGVDGSVALLGHSMASAVVVRYAREHPDIAATVAVSLFFSGEGTNLPRNLLIIDGALEPALLRKAALDLVKPMQGPSAVGGITYGSFASGSARRAVFAPDVEHIGVLYSPASMREALAWMNETFQREGNGAIDSRGPWLALLFAGLLGAAYALAGLLPRLCPVHEAPRLRGREFLALALGPALATPLILWKIPTNFLPILLADYLFVYFALYGVLTWIGLAWLGVLPRMPPWRAPGSRPLLAWVLSCLVVVAYAVFALGIPVDRYVTNLVPIEERQPYIGVLLLATLAYFSADEWLTRGLAAPRLATIATKCSFLLGLGLAIALNLPRLFFLVIIVPVILVLFIAYGLLSRWTTRQTGHPLAAALANALAFAWAITVVFPLVVRSLEPTSRP